MNQPPNKSPERTAGPSSRRFEAKADGAVPLISGKRVATCKLAEYRQNPEAGASWNEVEARIRKSPTCLSA